jgi:hypothetical protein
MAKRKREKVGAAVSSANEIMKSTSQNRTTRISALIASVKDWEPEALAWQRDMDLIDTEWPEY